MENTSSRARKVRCFTCREAYHILIHSKNIFFQYGNSCNILPFPQDVIVIGAGGLFLLFFFKEIKLFSTVWKVAEFISVSSLILSFLTNETKFYKSRQIYVTELYFFYITQRNKSRKNEMELYLLSTSTINTFNQWFKSSS